MNILVIPGGGGKTTLCQSHKNYFDIDNYWNINEEPEINMIKEFEIAKENNNTELIEKLIKDCMNYKAIKLKKNLNKKDAVILVQSVEQAKIITNNKEKIFCFVPSVELHEFVMKKRKDNDFVKKVCRQQRKNIIESGSKYMVYNNFQELGKLINENLN